MNRIEQQLLTDKKLLSIYFTAGYPSLENTVSIIKSLEKHGVDMIEIGLPFSDQLADGPTIQEVFTTPLIIEVLPCPNWPFALLPQHFTSLVSSSAQ